MGVDCEIYLPATARLDDIQDVIAILIGNKPNKKELPSGNFFIRVEGARARVCDGTPEMCVIHLEENPFNAQMCYVHFEVERRDGKSMAGYKKLSSKSRPVWIAIGRRLVDCFGGFMIDKDSADEITYRKKPRKDNDANDGEEWDGLKRRIFEIQPLTKADIQEAKKYAAYDS